ncbi:sugar transferase [Pseudidiomarina sp.]|uniref:sugar transferase n=1 Tax=Pseudidiomarina sp. TaxID=2081707 RepID=UPI003A98452D
MNYLVLKRCIDFIVAVFLAIVFLPLFILVLISIRLESKGNSFYLQRRVGKDGELFNIIKFRTMLRLEDSYDKYGKPLDNYERVTRIGKALRKTSLDELPQIFNIIIGEMSFIGPRPTLEYQVEKYSERERTRLKIRPGVSGWAQVNGRNSIPWEKKIELDIYYVENISFLLDIKILFKTIAVVFGREKTDFVAHDKFSQHDGKDWRDNIDKKL